MAQFRLHHAHRSAEQRSRTKVRDEMFRWWITIGGFRSFVSLRSLRSPHSMQFLAPAVRFRGRVRSSQIGGSEDRRHRVAGQLILPVPRRGLFDARRRMNRVPLEHVLKLGAQVDALQPAGRDQFRSDPDGLRSDLRPAIMVRTALLLWH